MKSNDTVIKVNKLSKCYRLGLKEKIKNNFAEVVFDFVKSPLKNYQKYRSLYEFDDRKKGQGNIAEDILWALDDVSLEVKRGELLGLVGGNGAGKSTLLKILSRVTPPTLGEAVVKGKIASLLEVGTGFHPELTGRENVYLNGIILGMKKKEVDAKYDEIVDFSGVKKFIDTPVKRYSSGMTVRLAFSVAAHLEPDILLVDEVLAVGDAAFQKKCIGKMNDVVSQGRTILFVSHNMGALENLCTSGICLEKGKVVMRGGISSVINFYLKKNSEDISNDPQKWKHMGNGEALITHATIKDATGAPCTTFKIGEKLIVEFAVEFFTSFVNIDNIALEIRQLNTGINVLHLLSQDAGFRLNNVSPGKKKIRVEIPNCMLYPGSYSISIYVGDGRPGGYDKVPDVLSFTLVQTNISKRTLPFLADKGIFHLQTDWQEF